MPGPTSETNPIEDLGDDLILRHSTPADTEALAQFNADIHRDEAQTERNDRIGAWVRDLMRGDHPTFAPGDFTIVEDKRDHRIISSLNLISQTWSYAGSEPFGVGRPELVGTLPEYRGRGLVRKQMNVVQRWSAERGQMMQAITGIPWYYRQFGYEMALDLSGGRMGFLPHIPKLPEATQEHYPIRPARESDLSFISKLYNASAQRYTIFCERDPVLWKYELNGRSPNNVTRSQLCTITDEEGLLLGFFAHQPELSWYTSMVVTCYELRPDIPWVATTPSVMRYLATRGRDNAQTSDRGEFNSFLFWLGRDHPMYASYASHLPQKRDPYAWYIRIPDLAGFLRHIASVFESRLRDSPLPNFTHEVTVSFYRSGLQLTFEEGRLINVTDWKPESPEAGDARFPDLTFLQLLLGYRSLSDLEYAFADCIIANDMTRVLLNALFPQRSSHVWAVA